MKMRSYTKRKNVAKVKQEFEDMKTISYANAKAYLNVEEMEMTPSTPGFVEEASAVESQGTTNIPGLEVPVIKNTYAHAKNNEAVKWKPKTRPTNKFHLNMKKLLNPKLQEEQMIEIEESSIEEDTQSRKMEGYDC